MTATTTGRVAAPERVALAGGASVAARGQRRCTDVDVAPGLPGAVQPAPGQEVADAGTGASFEVGLGRRVPMASLLAHGRCVAEPLHVVRRPITFLAEHAPRFRGALNRPTSPRPLARGKEYASGADATLEAGCTDAASGGGDGPAAPPLRAPGTAAATGAPTRGRTTTRAPGTGRGRSSLLSTSATGAAADARGALSTPPTTTPKRGGTAATARRWACVGCTSVPTPTVGATVRGATSDAQGRGAGEGRPASTTSGREERTAAH